MYQFMRNRFVLLAGAIACGWLISTAQCQDPKTPQDPAEELKKEQNALATEQKALATQYANLEEIFLRMSQLEAATNPTRAALLMQAAQMSKQLATQQRMNQASELLAKGQ